MLPGRHIRWLRWLLRRNCVLIPPPWFVFLYSTYHPSLNNIFTCTLAYGRYPSIGIEASWGKQLCVSTRLSCYNRLPARWTVPGWGLALGGRSASKGRGLCGCLRKEPCQRFLEKCWGDGGLPRGEGERWYGVVKPGWYSNLQVLWLEDCDYLSFQRVQVEQQVRTRLARLRRARVSSVPVRALLDREQCVSPEEGCIGSQWYLGNRF